VFRRTVIEQRRARACIGGVALLVVVAGACSGGSGTDGDATAVTARPVASPGPTVTTSQPDGSTPTTATTSTTDATGAVGVSTSTSTSGAPSSTEGQVTPTTVANVGSTGDVPVPDTVERVVSLSPTHTETLFAIGAGDLVVAVDGGSDHPAEAAAVQDPALTDQLADIGPIVALDPDLVVVGDDPTDVAGRLRAAGIPAWAAGQPADVEGAFAQIAELGRLVDRSDAAADVVGSMRAELASLRAGLPADGTLSYFHEIDPSLYTVAPGTFLDAAYGALGLTSIVPVSGEPFVQLAADGVVAADPDVIVLADAECCGATAATVAARPGWDAVSAVESGAIVAVDEDVVARWGPRLVELWRAVAAAAATAA
jgi:iron complex transport system substrate-binding protein